LAVDIFELPFFIGQEFPLSDGFEVILPLGEPDRQEFIDPCDNKDERRGEDQPLDDKLHGSPFCLRSFLFTFFHGFPQNAFSECF
jgi:hypothetical protein